MLDRVPTKPGRVKVTRDDGTTEYVTLERADEPTQEGTPLNKSTLLSDETARLFALVPPRSYTVDKALAQLLPRIGDISISALPGGHPLPHSKWTLCDGLDIVTRRKYSDLQSRLESAWVKDIDLGTGATVNQVRYINNKWVLCNSDNTISYASSPDGPWTTVTILTGSYDNTNVSDIIYANGYYVVSAYARDDSYTYHFIMYSTSLDGPWTKSYEVKNNATSDYQWNASRAAYGNGYWVFTSSNGHSSNVLYTTDITSGTWSSKQIDYESGDTNGTGIGSPVFADGKFLVGSSNWSKYNDYDYLWWATDPSGTWTNKSLPLGDKGGVHQIFYDGFSFIVCAGKMGLWWPKDKNNLAGDWENYVIPGFEPYSIILEGSSDNDYVVVGRITADNNALAIASSYYIDSGWRIQAVDENKTSTSTWSASIAWGGDKYIVTGKEASPSRAATFGRKDLLLPYGCLPNINIGAPAYIRVEA